MSRASCVGVPGCVHDHCLECFWGGCSFGWNADNFPCRLVGWWGSTLLGPEGISIHQVWVALGCVWCGGLRSHRTACCQVLLVVGLR